INTSNLFTINKIGSGGTAAPDIANSLTLSDVQAKLVFSVDGALDVVTTLSLNSLMNLGIAGPVENSVLSMGGSAGGGTILLGTSGLLEGALGDQVLDIGTTATEIMGSGTVIAQSGLFQFGTSVQVAPGDLTKFQINPNATLGFADAVGGGTIVFTANSGSGVLNVAALSTFSAPITGLSMGTGASIGSNGKPSTSYIDFLNVGTSA